MMRTVSIFIVLCACGSQTSQREGPPPSCADVATKVHSNCVEGSDQPCDGSVYTAAYDACVKEIAAGRAVCLPNGFGYCTGYRVPAEVTLSGEVATTEGERTR